MFCPDCKDGTITGMGCPGFKPVTIKCPRCNGTHEIPDIQAVWIEEGKLIRAWREKRDLSLREAANLLLILPSYYSDIERGRVEAKGPIRKLLYEEV